MKPFAFFTEYHFKSSFATLVSLAAGMPLFASVLVSPAVVLAGQPVLDIERQMTDLTQKLHLSDEQAEQVRPICEETIQEIRKMMMQTLMPWRGGRQATREKIMELINNTEERMSEILTQEQMKAYRQTVAEKQQDTQSWKTSGNKTF